MSVQSFDLLLVAFGVDLGFPEQREAKAQALEDASLDLADVADLFAHFEASRDAETAPRISAAMAVEPQRLRQAIVDLRAYQKAKEARRAGSVRSPYPGQGLWKSKTEWDELDRCRAAACRVDTDRHEPAAVAHDLGVSVDELSGMLTKGRVLRMVAADK